MPIPWRILARALTWAALTLGELAARAREHQARAYADRERRETWRRAFEETEAVMRRARDEHLDFRTAALAQVTQEAREELWLNEETMPSVETPRPITRRPDEMAFGDMYERSRVHGEAYCRHWFRGMP